MFTFFDNMKNCRVYNPRKRLLLSVQQLHLKTFKSRSVLENSLMSNPHSGLM